ncbi:MAG: transposase [bacterium]
MAVRDNKIFIPDRTYFITFTILDWKYVFINDEYCGLVYKWFDYLKEKYNNKIYGYVIMPNHIHALIKITNESAKLSTIVMNAKRFLTYEIIMLLERSQGDNLLNFFKINARTKNRARHKVFKDRYDSLLIESQEFFLQKLNYIHKNPCQEKWQLAKSPEDYKYLSASNYSNCGGYYNVDIAEF